MRKIVYLLASLLMLSSLTNCGGENAKKDYLCFTGEEDNSSIMYEVHVRPETPDLDIHIQNSKDGKSWQDWNKESEIKLNTDEKIYVRNTKKTLSKEVSPLLNSFQFVMGGKIAASGSVMSMINFGELYDHCFAWMFNGCRALITPPELPAKKLAPYCYDGMFRECNGLETTPELPATTLEEGCYNSMFQVCDSLIAPPVLPATTLADKCYAAMFSSCASLKSAPFLPATTLKEKCYYNMFSLCGSLHIKEDDGENLIFNCPEGTLPDRAVEDMFLATFGSVKTPNPGHSYYWHTH